ncbi:hypothetical protein TNCV_4602931 [Trichonephila clavipes]|nr:hypothetical protein TNCV_4602931 [Trichonephila clavipes]
MGAREKEEWLDDNTCWSYLKLPADGPSYGRGIDDTMEMTELEEFDLIPEEYDQLTGDDRITSFQGHFLDEKNCGGGDRGRVAIYRPFGEPIFEATMKFDCVRQVASENNNKSKKSGTGIELVTRQATIRYLYHSATAATAELLERSKKGEKVTDVSREFDIAHSVVSRLWKSFKTAGICSRRHGGGRVRSTTPAEDRYIVLSAKRNRRTTAQQVANRFLAASGKISRKTVARRLKGGGLYARRPVVCVPLSRQYRTASLQ